MPDYRYLQKMGLVTIRPNEDETLLVINYTPKVQYEGLWDDDLMQCRGLIVDSTTWEIKARPFKKFFNIEELSPSDIPNEPFTVTEKMDGSLGIGYYHNNQYKIATRGSFVSEQAIKATELINTKYKDYPFMDEYTYLFEIIYPQNKIVVDYGNEEKLVLLAKIHTATGKEEPINNELFPDKVRTYKGVEKLSILKSLEEPNKEGFVVRFKSGMRVKVKFDEYKRLHRIITGVSNRSIWEYLKDGKDINELLDNVPDEFYKWVKETSNNLKAGFLKEENKYKQIFKSLMSANSGRKDFAIRAKKHVLPGVLFNMYDNKPYAHIIWKKLKPKYEKPFKTEI